MQPSYLFFMTLEERERLARVEAREFEHQRIMAEAKREARALPRSSAPRPRAGRLGAFVRRLVAPAPAPCPDGSATD